MESSLIDKISTTFQISNIFVTNVRKKSSWFSKERTSKYIWSLNMKI